MPRSRRASSTTGSGGADTSGAAPAPEQHRPGRFLLASQGAAELLAGDRTAYSVHFPRHLGRGPPDAKGVVPPALWRAAVYEGGSERKRKQICDVLDRIPKAKKIRTGSGYADTLADLMHPTQMLSTDVATQAYSDTACVLEAAGDVVRVALGLPEGNQLVETMNMKWTINPSPKGVNEIFVSPPDVDFNAEVRVPPPYGDNTFLQCTFNGKNPVATWSQLCEHPRTSLERARPADFVLKGAANWSRIDVRLNGAEQMGGSWSKQAATYMIKLVLVKAKDSPPTNRSAEQFNGKVVGVKSIMLPSVASQFMQSEGPILRASVQAAGHVCMFCQTVGVIGPAPERTLIDGTPVGAVSTPVIEDVLAVQERVAAKMNCKNLAVNPDEAVRVVALVNTAFSGKSVTDGDASKLRQSVWASLVFWAIFYGLDNCSYKTFVTLLQLVSGVSTSKEPPKQTWNKQALNKWAKTQALRILVEDGVVHLCDELKGLVHGTSKLNPKKGKRPNHLKASFVLAALSCDPAKRIGFDAHKVVRMLTRSAEFLLYLRGEVRANDNALARSFMKRPEPGVSLEKMVGRWYLDTPDRNVGLWQAFDVSGQIDLLIKGLYMAVAEWVDASFREVVTHETLAGAASVLELLSDALVAIGVDGLPSYYSKHVDPRYCPDIPWLIMYLISDLSKESCEEIEVRRQVDLPDVVKRAYMPYIGPDHAGVFFVAMDADSGKDLPARRQLGGLGMVAVYDRATTRGMGFSAIYEGQALPDIMAVMYDEARIRCRSAMGYERPKWAQKSAVGFERLLAQYHAHEEVFEKHFHAAHGKKGHRVPRFTAFRCDRIKPAASEFERMLGDFVLPAQSVVRIPDEIMPREVPTYTFNVATLGKIGFFIKDNVDFPLYAVPVPLKRRDKELSFLVIFFVYDHDSTGAPTVFVTRQHMHVNMMEVIKTDPHAKLVAMLLDPSMVVPYEGVRGPPGGALMNRACSGEQYADLRALIRSLGPKATSTFTMSTSSHIDDVFRSILEESKHDVTWSEMACGVSVAANYLSKGLGLGGYEYPDLHYIWGEKLTSFLQHARLQVETQAIIERDEEHDKRYSALLDKKDRARQEAIASMAKTGDDVRALQMQHLPAHEQNELNQACVDTMLAQLGNVTEAAAAYDIVSAAGAPSASELIGGLDIGPLGGSAQP